MVAGSFLSCFLSERWDALKVILIGSSVVSIFAAGMLLLFLLGMINTWTLFLPMIFIYTGFSLIYSNASSVALSHAPDKANASAVMHFCNLGLAVVTLFIITAIPDQQPYLMPLVFTLMGLGMLAMRKWLVVLTRAQTVPA